MISTRWAYAPTAVAIAFGLYYEPGATAFAIFLMVFSCTVTWCSLNRHAVRIAVRKLVRKPAEMWRSRTDKWGDPWVGPGRFDLFESQRINSFEHERCPHCGQRDIIYDKFAGFTDALCTSCGSNFKLLFSTMYDSSDKPFDVLSTVELLRDCTDPIPEIEDPALGRPKRATHDHNGKILGSEPPPPGARMAAIRATREKQAYA